MKLRLYADSIRLRLTPADVETLRNDEAVLDVTHLGGSSRIEYAISIDSEADQMRASFADGRLRVILPIVLAEDWINTGEVGISHQQALPEGGWLKILVEKEFECLHEEENEPGVVFYPNPNRKC